MENTFTSLEGCDVDLSKSGKLPVPQLEGYAWLEGSNWRAWVKSIHDHGLGNFIMKGNDWYSWMGSLHEVGLKGKAEADAEVEA